MATPSGREGFFHFTSSIKPGSDALTTARNWPSLSPLQPVVFLTMASICWDADRSLMPVLCCRGSAPSLAFDGCEPGLGAVVVNRYGEHRGLYRLYRPTVHEGRA